MERELRIFEMSDTANPTSLACSRLLQERLPRGYTAMRARRAVNLKVVPHIDDDLWSFVMLPDNQPAGAAYLSLLGSCFAFLICPDSLLLQLVKVHVARSDPPTPQSQATGRATAAGAGAGSPREREEDQAVREPRAVQ
jgi:hypothetical protein